jgi:hypothetical protein
MSTDTKVIGGIGLLTLVILIGGVWLLSAQGAKEQKQLSTPLIGQEVADQGANHVPDGTKVEYNSNPPSSGSHFAKPQPGGYYDKPVQVGNLVHSLEHGAVIVWYKPDISKADIEKIKSAFDSASASKKIMVPGENLDVPVALTSWTRILKLNTIDEAKIKQMLETNNDRGPEKAPLVM